MCENTTISGMIINQMMMQKKELETGVKILDKIIDNKNTELEELKNKYDALYRKYCLLLDKNEELETENQLLVEKVTVYENGMNNMKESMAIIDMMLNGYDGEEEDE